MRLYLGLTAIGAACLIGCSPGPPHAAGATAGRGIDGATAGQRVFEGSCVACHRQDGRGIPGAYPSLAGSALVLGDVQPLAAWVVEGRRPAAWPAGRYSTAMPTFGWLDDENAAALFTYLRTHFGNSAAPVAAADVARALGRR